MAEGGGGGPEIQQPVQERVDPVKEYATAVDSWFNLFYRLGWATRPRLAGVPTPLINPQMTERSLHTRFERARLYKDLVKERALQRKMQARIKVAKVDWVGINRLKQDLDTFDRQFLNQGDLSIDIPELGIQGSRYAVVELPSRKEVAQSKPPIFLVPALSGDLNGVAPLMREAALQGRRVVTVGYPESFMGKTTEAFAQASQISPNFEPHTTYFKKAIEALLGTEGDIELWGYSTGGGLVTEILNDPRFQQRVTNAVIIAPGGSVEQSKRDVIKGVLHEVKEVFKRPKSIGDTVVAYARKLPIEAVHKKLRDRIFFSTLFNKVGKRVNSWEGIKVKEGGKVIIVTGQKDEITKSYQADQELLGLSNPQINLLDIQKGSHLSPLTQARTVVGKIAEIRDNPQAPHHTLL